MTQIINVFLLFTSILLIEPVSVLGQDQSSAVPPTTSASSLETSQSSLPSTSTETTPTITPTTTTSINIATTTPDTATTTPDTATTNPDTATTTPSTATTQTPTPTPVDHETTSLPAMPSRTKAPAIPLNPINLFKMLPDLGELKGILMGFAMRQELTPCTADLMRTVQAAQRKELWAMQLFDSWGKPGPSLLEYRVPWVGDYDQCRSTRAPPRLGKEGYKGDYCVLKMSPADKNAKPMKMSATPDMQYVAAVGICIPDTCSEEEVGVLAQGLIEAVNLGSVMRVGVTQCRDDHREVTAATVMAIIVLAILGILLLGSTALDLIFIQWPKWHMSHELEKHKENCNAIENGKAGKSGEHSESKDTEKKEEMAPCNGKLDKLEMNGTHNAVPEPSTSNERNPLLKRDEDFWKGRRGKTLVSFSLYTNCDRLFNTSEGVDSVTCMFGMRFFTISWIILGHFHVQCMHLMQNTLEAFQTLQGSWSYDIITNAFCAVDTFLTISGFLVGYGFCKIMVKNGWRINWGKALVHRYFRLTPAYALVLLVALGLQRYMGSGALWDTDQPPDKDACEKYWWMNLLYMNNVRGYEDICMLQSWYMSVDFQLYSLAPMLLIPLYLNKYAGAAVAFVSLLISWIVSGVVTARYGLGTHVFEGPKSGDPGRFTDFLNYYYTPFYTRLGPYVVGMLAGWWLAFTDKKVSLPRYVLLVGWIASIAIALAVQFGIHDDIDMEEDSLPSGVQGLYNALSKTAWGLSISWFIIACSLGYGGLANKLLSSPPMIVLGRLSYMMYLSHVTVIFVFYGNMEKAFTWTETTLTFVFLGIVVVTTAVSFLLHLIIEAPSMNLVRSVLSK